MSIFDKQLLLRDLPSTRGGMDEWVGGWMGGWEMCF